MPIGLVINKETGGSAVGDTNPLPVKLNDGTRTVDITTSGAVGTYDGLVLYGRDVNGTYFPLPLTAGGGTMITIAGQGGGTLGSEVLANQGTAGTDPWLATGTVAISDGSQIEVTNVSLDVKGTIEEGSSATDKPIIIGGKDEDGYVAALQTNASKILKVTLGNETIGVTGTVVASGVTVTGGTEVKLLNGTNTVGSVIVAALPSVTIGTALPPSNALIGTVSLGAGGTVAVTIPSVTIGTALPASNAVIGTVTVGALPSVTIGTAVPAGNATIGSITLNAGGTVAVTLPAVTGTVAVTTGSFYLLNQLIPQSFDALTMTYTGGSDISQVVYKTGGTGGAAVATLTLGYSGGSLTSVART